MSLSQILAYDFGYGLLICSIVQYRFLHAAAFLDTQISFVTVALA